MEGKDAGQELAEFVATVKAAFSDAQPDLESAFENLKEAGYQLVEAFGEVAEKIGAALDERKASGGSDGE